MTKETNKKKSNIFKRKIVRFIITPLLLLVLWFVSTLSYIIYLDSSFSLISHNLPITIFTHLPSGKLEKGDYISGKFVAHEDNLGILSLRFQTFFRPSYQNEDHLLFQIREVGQDKWYYQNAYRVGTIYDVPFFPFGFPKISNSKGRVYEFRIISLNGDKNNSVALNNRWQNVAAKYKFTKQEILQNKIKLIQFSVEKFTSSFERIDVIFSSLIYLLPLFFYLILISPLEKHLSNKLSILGNSRLLNRLLPSYDISQRYLITLSDSILIGAVLLDGVYLQLENNFVYLLLPSLWIVAQEHFRFTSGKTFKVGIIFLLLPPVFLLFGLGQTAENMAVWAFLFLSTGIIQSIIEVSKSPDKSYRLESISTKSIEKPKKKREKGN